MGTDDVRASRSPRRGQILCFVLAVFPLVVAVAFTTNVALSLDPVYAMLPNPEPTFREVVGAAVTRLRVMLAILAVGLVILGVAAGRVERLRRVFSLIPTQVAIALLILIAPVGIAELAARTLILGSDEQFSTDPNAGYRWRANANFPYGYVPLITNDKGMRGPPVEYEKRPGTKRVLFLGSAMLVSRGLAMEDAIPWVTQAILREQIGPSVEVINTAVTGWKVQNTVPYMINEGYRYAPDVVVICVTLYDIVGRQPKKPPAAAPQPALAFTEPYRSWSAITSWLKMRDKFGAYYKVSRRTADEIRFKVEGAPPKGPFALRWSHPVTHPDDPAVQTAWHDVFNQLDELIADSHKRNYQVVIVAYPLASQLGGDERAKKSQAMLTKFGADRGVPVLDLQPPIEAELHATGTEARAYYIDGDHHPSRRAARFIGNEVARFLLEHAPSLAPTADQRSHQ